MNKLTIVVEKGEIAYKTASHMIKKKLEKEFDEAELPEHWPASLKSLLKQTRDAGCEIWPNVLPPIDNSSPVNDRDFVRSLYSISEIQEYAQDNIPEKSRTVPSDYLVIARTNWNWRILMSIKKQDYGSIWCCPYLPNEPWNEPPGQILRVAGSLQEFFLLLTEDREQKVTYQSGWVYRLGDNPLIRHFKIADLALDAEASL